MSRKSSGADAKVDVRHGDDIWISRTDVEPNDVMFEGLKRNSHYCDMSVRLKRKASVQLHAETGANRGRDYPSVRFVLIVNGGVYSNPPYNSDGILDVVKSPEGQDWNDWDGELNAVVTFEANMDYWIRAWAYLDKCFPINTLLRGTLIKYF